MSTETASLPPDPKHVTLNENLELSCKHCGATHSKSGKKFLRETQVIGHLSGCPEYSRQSFSDSGFEQATDRVSDTSSKDYPSHGDLLDVRAYNAACEWFWRKWDEKKERVWAASGLLAALQIMPALATDAELFQFSTAVGMILVVALAGDAGWLGASPKLQKAVASERTKRVSNFGPLSSVSNKVGKSFQFGFGAALGILVAMIAPELGYQVPQVTDLIRLFIGGV